MGQGDIVWGDFGQGDFGRGDFCQGGFLLVSCCSVSTYTNRSTGIIGKPQSIKVKVLPYGNAFRCLLHHFRVSFI